MRAPVWVNVMRSNLSGWCDHPALRSRTGLIGLAVLLSMLLACFGSLPWTLRDVGGTPAYDLQIKEAARLPPWWWPHTPDERARLDAAAEALAWEELARSLERSREAILAEGRAPSAAAVASARPAFWLGTDVLGRSLLARVLVGGAISLTVGLCAAAVSVLLGTVYGALAGYAGGRADAIMMRAVDVLYGLPYVLLVVLLSVASNAALDEFTSRSRARTAWITEQAAAEAARRGLPADRAGVREWLGREPELAESLRARAEFEPGLARRVLSPATRLRLDLLTLLVAIGGVSWLTMARVVRGQVMSLRARPFMEAARALALPAHRQFFAHLLPNLSGVIIVYATLLVPQAMLQESFLSFLGIGVKPPLPSLGNLAADGLEQLNPVRSRWWVLVFPCAVLASTLLSLNFFGEALREALDPRRNSR